MVVLNCDEPVFIIPSANKVLGGYIGISLSNRLSIFLISTSLPKWINQY